MTKEEIKQLVKKAYKEGWYDGVISDKAQHDYTPYSNNFDEQKYDWESSQTKKKLETKLK